MTRPRDAEHLRDVDRRGMDHGFQVIDGADGSHVARRCRRKGLVYLALYRGAAVGRTEGDAQAAEVIKSWSIPELSSFLRYLAGVIGHGPHRFAERTLEVVVTG